MLIKPLTHLTFVRIKHLDIHPLVGFARLELIATHPEILADRLHVHTKFSCNLGFC